MEVPNNHSAYSIAIHFTLSELNPLEVGSSGLFKDDGFTNPRHFSLNPHQKASKDDEIASNADTGPQSREEPSDIRWIRNHYYLKAH